MPLRPEAPTTMALSRPGPALDAAIADRLALPLRLYSSEIDSAWLVVKWLRARACDVRLATQDAIDEGGEAGRAADRWLCVVGIQASPVTHVEYYDVAETAPLAICRAALGALER